MRPFSPDLPLQLGPLMSGVASRSAQHRAICLRALPAGLEAAQPPVGGPAAWVPSPPPPEILSLFPFLALDSPDRGMVLQQCLNLVLFSPQARVGPGMPPANTPLAAAQVGQRAHLGPRLWGVVPRGGRSQLACCGVWTCGSEGGGLVVVVELRQRNERVNVGTLCGFGIPPTPRWLGVLCTLHLPCLELPWGTTRQQLYT